MWNKILANPSDKKYTHTLKEVLQQPTCWKKTVELILKNKQLHTFLEEACQDKNRAIIVSGAGSSEFAGKSILDTLRKSTNRYVINAPTTDIVTHPDKYNFPYPPALMISFARSGNSPESVASVNLIKQTSPTTKHLIITCNKDGQLAQIQDTNTFCILLPEETNDKSLVMTSSFSSMVLAAALCGLYKKGASITDMIQEVKKCTEHVFSNLMDPINELLTNPKIDRIQFLGSSDAQGFLTEAHLKILEMTDGQVATRIDSFLGLRHGPQVFVTPNTIVVAVLSNDPYIRQYEIDMLKELKQKSQGLAYIIVGHNPDEVAMPNMITCSTEKLDDFFQLFPAIAICQMIGFFKSLHLGLSPDAPSASGTINRVVQGVNIYPYHNK
ncbi:MAG: SIS domain-containing protein [Brevinema sp.]